jgi:hypothetical protein
MAQVQVPSIDLLLNLVPERPQVVLEKLQAHPDIASKQDAHGYSLVHAAASYAHLDLLRALIQEFNVDPNIKDEDGETALFSVEDVEMAKALIELGTDMSLRNNDDQTAAQKLADEDEQPAIAAYLREVAGSSEDPTAGGATNGAAAGQGGFGAPPPLPEGLQLNIGTMIPEEAGEADPEFRRRIEELAAREDFETEEGQRALRDLITDALSGVASEGQGPPQSRRRVD